MSSLTFLARILPNGPCIKVYGRNAWALQQLHAAGELGCTAIDNPAPRWCEYVCNLRKMGFEIQTLYERQEGELLGSHARYILRSQVLLTSTCEEAAQ
jgi:hypothetical protein